MASRNFSNLARVLATAGVNFESDTFKVMIVNAVPSESQLDTWVSRADVTSEIAATGGYSAGGFPVTVTLGTLDAVNDRVSVTVAAADPVYATSTISGVGCVLYKSTGTAASDLLIGFVDWLGTVSSIDGPFRVVFSNPMYIDVTPA